MRLRGLMVPLIALAIWGLWLSAVSPAYLVEGGRNWLGFDFAGKEAYVRTVNAVRLLYWAVTGGLVAWILLRLRR